MQIVFKWIRFIVTTFFRRWNSSLRIEIEAFAWGKKSSNGSCGIEIKKDRNNFTSRKMLLLSCLLNVSYEILIHSLYHYFGMHYINKLFEVTNDYASFQWILLLAHNFATCIFTTHNIIVWILLLKIFTIYISVDFRWKTFHFL